MAKKLLSESKAQTGMEYLLILAGAIIVVIIVGYILKSIAKSSGEEVNQQTSNTG